MQRITLKLLVGILLIATLPFKTIGQETYAEKLGFEKGKKVLIMHVDDMGMSYSSNIGGLKAINEGLATSGSIMMPCSWVPDLANRVGDNSNLDLGLHLTLTSEWDNYRWGPIIGSGGAPSLVDSEGKLFKSVAEVVSHGSVEEVEKELRAQILLAKSMGFEPTHLDSHMGTLFATPEFLSIYLKLGMEYGIPVMIPVGHNTLISKGISKELNDQTKAIGKQLWDSGLPVIDDLLNESYGWNLPEAIEPTDENLQKFKTEKYIEAIERAKPGITYVIMHCSEPSDIFDKITKSGDTRKGDLLAMLDPKLLEYIEKEGIVFTTFKELHERRRKLIK